MNATTMALDAALFDTAPPLSAPTVANGQIEPTEAHPLDFAVDLPGCLHVFSIDSDIKSVKHVKPRLREIAIIAFLMKNPTATTVDVCRFFQCGPGIVQAVMKSDLFKHKLAEAQVALLESKDFLSLQNEMAAGAQLAAEVVNQKILSSEDPELALKAVSVYTKAMGMGVSKGTNININQPVATAEMLRAARDANVIDVTFEETPHVVTSNGTSNPVAEGFPVVDFDEALFSEQAVPLQLVEGEALTKALGTFEAVPV